MFDSRRTDGTVRNRISPSGPVLTLEEVALLLWDDKLTDRVLPRNQVHMIEKRALAKLRRHPEIRRLAREAFGRSHKD
jgi:hypothetical protein